MRRLIENKTAKAITVLIAIILLTPIVLQDAGYAVSFTSLYVSPESIEIPVESFFDVFLECSTPYYVGGFGVILTYDTTIIDALDVIPARHFVTMSKEVNDPAGQVMIQGAWDQTGDPPTGEFELAQFYFQCTGEGNSVLTIAQHMLMDPAGFPIPVDEVRSGFVGQNWYWKPMYRDYVPSGMPDFDQKQWGTYIWQDYAQAWSHCGPVAVANSLWWLDSEFEISIPTPPPTISDNFPLVRAYGPWDDHDPQNVPPLVEHLAYLMDTDGRRTQTPMKSGTNVIDMQVGITHYLSWSGVNPLGDVNGDGIVDTTDQAIVTAALGSSPGSPNWNLAADIYPDTQFYPIQPPPPPGLPWVDANDLALVNAHLGQMGFFYEHTMPQPDFYFIEEEVERCQDVVLLIEYWLFDPQFPEGWYWYDIPGHFVTVAGVDSTDIKIALSDPSFDNAEAGFPGRIPVPHAHMPPEPPYTMHNDAKYVSQDIYNVMPIPVMPPFPPCPGGNWALVNYPGMPQVPGMYAVITQAVITSPNETIRDINVTAIKTNKTVVGKGRNLNITASILNEGSLTETFTVDFYANSTLIGTVPIISLVPGSNINITYTWNTTGWAKAVNISATCTPLPGEADLTDNTKYCDTYVKVSCIGDINGDYVTDSKDFVLVKKAIPSVPGDPKWNPNADMNDSNSCTVTDYQIVKNNIPSIDP
jgi:hypothetical protein